MFQASEETDSKMKYKSRGEVICDLAKKKITGKTLCHIGCGTGEITQEFSKLAKKIIAIEIEEDKSKDAKKLNYGCETEIVHGDAYEYLKNLSTNPETFYFWAGFRPKVGGMQWWLEAVIKLFGELAPDVIFGISLSEHNGHYVDGIPLQLNTAKMIQKIYGGNILSGDYSKANERIPFGLFSINLKDLQINEKTQVSKLWKIEYKTINEHKESSPTVNFEKYYMDRLGHKK